MRDLSDYVKNGFMVKAMTNSYEYADSIESVDSIIDTLNYGIFMDIKFKNSYLKDYFIDKITTFRHDSNIINCNCSLDKYYENDFSGYLIFNNIGKCKQPEILEDINKYKSIRLC